MPRFGRLKITPRRCPHAEAVQYCPLYVASHSALGNGCDDGHLDTGRCAVDRGRSYDAGIRAMLRTEPDLLMRVIAGGLAHRLGTEQRKH